MAKTDPRKAYKCPRCLKIHRHGRPLCASCTEIEVAERMERKKKAMLQKEIDKKAQEKRDKVLNDMIELALKEKRVRRVESYSLVEEMDRMGDRSFGIGQFRAPEMIDLDQLLGEMRRL